MDDENIGDEIWTNLLNTIFAKALPIIDRMITKIMEFWNSSDFKSTVSNPEKIKTNIDGGNMHKKLPNAIATGDTSCRWAFSMLSEIA